ncbi:hypothetical protein GUJ93_ZPchr0002g26305 [Zizania palustris]|uniref:SBP-type domain-containing protein n=1 Tax=Zizania palustris TaxID=103762 RepID=A0A8J5S1F4_ZIZPA|nr:hypothetical protein GUJ93_ZPchr0002g26305 [Zizania palustris]
METGGGSGGGAGGDDVRGLKFGKKIYFEQDAAGGNGGGPGEGGGGSAASTGGGRKGKGKGVTGAGAGAGASVPAPAPPRCQVEGCGVDLSGAKPYYCRHKLCSMHSKAPRVIVAGLEQRFCQQCSRFHRLAEFDQGKRSCRRRLAGHNERRRRQPHGPLSSRYGRLAASFHEEPGRFRSFLMDFSDPRVPGSVRDASWPAVPAGGDRMSGGAVQWQGSHEVHPHRGAVAGYGDHHAYSSSSSHGGSAAGAPMLPAFELPSGGCLAGVATDPSCALSLLSIHPWDTAQSSSSHHRSPAMSTTSAFEGGHTVAPSVMASNYMMANSSSRGHEGGGARSGHMPPHGVSVHDVHPGGSVHHGHFSGELELALQGSGPSNPPAAWHGHGSGSAFSHSTNDAMDWSL